PVGALGDKFRPATSFVTVACVSGKRWFDLDAVRHEHGSFAGNLIQYSDNGEGRSDRKDFGKQRYSSHHPAGAPPLDWWDANDCDPDDWQPLHRLPTKPYKGSHYAA